MYHRAYNRAQNIEFGNLATSLEVLLYYLQTLL